MESDPSVPKAEHKASDEDIQAIIEGFRHRLHAMQVLTRTQLAHAREYQERERERLQSEANKATMALMSGEVKDAGRAANTWLTIKQALEEHEMCSHEELLAETIFTSLFCELDAYIGQLVRTFYLIRPELLNNSGDRTVHFDQLLTKTKDEIIEKVIDKEVDTLLRSSYVKSFERLAKLFSCGSLTNYPNWSKFVECAQRRNIVTHCGGIVTSQYREVCKSVGVDLKGVEVGQKLHITPDYLKNAIELVAETGLKLGQVLWRALRDSSIPAADVHLGQCIFNLLKRDEVAIAKRLGEFGEGCANRAYKLPRNERSLKIIQLNHAQAAKWLGNEVEARRVLHQTDWSGSALEFLLGVAVLREEWMQAAELMRQIGPNSPYMADHAYHGWPIFRRFRETEEFLTMYSEVFGVPFAQEFKREKDESSQGGDSHEPPSDDDQQSTEN